MILIGIDPGMHGAIAVKSRAGIRLYNIPTVTVKGKTDVDFRSLSNILRSINDMRTATTKVYIACEKSQAMAFHKTQTAKAFHDSGVSEWKKGYNYGVLRAMFICYNLPYTATPRPGDWKRRLKLTDSKLTDKEKKDKARCMAMDLFPEFIPALKHQTDSDKAEALLLIVWLEKELRLK